MSPAPAILLKALRQLGPGRLALYARYQIGLRSGWYRLRSAAPPRGAWRFTPPLPLPGREALHDILGERAGELLAEADQIAAGQVRLFGGAPVPLELAPAATPVHWTQYELGRAPWGTHVDVKFVWEPARFGWAYPLARAFALSGGEQYAEAFWRAFEEFDRANPPYSGPQWASGQEVALRLIALSFAGGALADAAASTPARRERLAEAIAAHARRIPLTLVYARAQHNNHLISEAAGLYTAGLVLRGAPQAAAWRALGWRWLNDALQAQIAPDGTYVQQSTNYHRLALQLALWCGALAGAHGDAYPPATREALAAAAAWLARLLDAESGCVPNLGANDGAYVQPLAVGGFADYRPVIQAAARAWHDHPALPPGAWDEAGAWLCQDLRPQPAPAPLSAGPAGGVWRLEGAHSWAALRAVRFIDRPSHADQLHVDLWWRGVNLALDAGTYLYNGSSPWDNRLSSARAHNTVTIDGREPMLRAGRFLWLDWAQAEVTAAAEDLARAHHDGYAQLSVRHERTLRRTAPNAWLVEDRLLPLRPGAGPRSACLHWLLPDLPWRLEDATFILTLPTGEARLTITSPDPLRESVSIARAGEALSGGPAAPIDGWISPTYGLKLPALALRVTARRELPITFTSRWQLPD